MRTLKQLRESQDGVVAYVVATMLVVLLTTTAIGAAVGSIETTKASGKAATDIMVLDIAKLCQNKNVTCSTADIETKIKASEEFKSVVTKNGLNIDDVKIDSFVTNATTHRSQVRVILTKQARIPFASLLGRSKTTTVVSQSKASWTDYDYITKFSKGSYLPLFVNACILPTLRKSAVGIDYGDNLPCSTANSDPQTWWFGNAGGATGSCFVNNAGPDIKVGDVVNNSSTQTMPANENCYNNVYVVPYFRSYKAGGPTLEIVTTTSYEKVWTVFTQAVVRKNNGTLVKTYPGVTQTYTKICSTSSAAFDDTVNCSDTSGSPTPSSGATCVGVTVGSGEKCAVEPNPVAPTLVSTTSKTRSTSYEQWILNWTQESKAVKTSKSGQTTTTTTVSTVVQTWTKTCRHADDQFSDAVNCKQPGTASPAAGATCVGVVLAGNETCAVVTSTQVFKSAVQQFDSSYATVAGFMKVKLVNTYFTNALDKNRTQPDHIYVLAYAGKDIRLIPN